MTIDTSKRDAALSYAARGWAVFPLKVGAKTPATPHGFKDATTDAGKISAWWDENPGYNVGISTGASGLLVVDLDEDSAKDKHGIDTLAQWEDAHGKLPFTVGCATPRGGRHLYFATDEAYKSSTDIYPAIDIRALGGYVVAPPSEVNGRRYVWNADPAIVAVAALDETLRAFLTPKSPQRANASDDEDNAFIMPETIGEGRRTSALMQMLGSMQAKGMSDDAIRAAIRAENARRCIPPLSDVELDKEIFPALRRFQKGTAPYTLDRTYDAKTAELVGALKSMHPESNKRYGRLDAGNGNLFADLYADRVRFVADRKRWYIYDGVRWAPDAGNIHVMNLCKSAADALMMYALGIRDEETRTVYIKHAAKWQQQKYRETILKDAATVAGARAADFDGDPYLLNCKNGTLDLKTLTFRGHRSADLVTRCANVAYAPAARCDRWERFIDEIFCGDADLAAYVQKALGYALTGGTQYECLFILYGATTRNGKSTLCETFLQMVGDYGKTASPETVARRKYADARAPSEDVARLAGARFVSMSEPEKKMVLNASLIKALTGNDTITARFLGEGSFEFKPQMKIFLNTNHLPNVSDPTLFSSDRLKVIPFARHFEEHERDPLLKTKLTTPEALSGILNWCIDGLRLLTVDGFGVPQVTHAATEEYREEADRFGNFIADYLVASPDGEVDAHTVHAVYRDWCYDNGYTPEGFGEFRKSLVTAGIDARRKRPRGGKENDGKRTYICGYLLRKST